MAEPEYAMTPWGYAVDAPADGSFECPITAQEFQAMTGGRFADEDQASSALAAAFSAIRDACGWHVCPQVPCEEYAQGPARALRLKTLLAQGVEVRECGRDLEEGEFEYSFRGIVRRACFRAWPAGLDSVRLRYISGFEPETCSGFVACAVQVASNMLAAPAGVQSESAGNVSISYNQTASGVSGGIRLLESDIAMLRPYMLERGL